MSEFEYTQEFGDEDPFIVLQNEDDAELEAFLASMERKMERANRIGALSFLMHVTSVAISHPDIVKEEDREEAMQTTTEAFAALGVTPDEWEDAKHLLLSQMDDEYRSGPNGDGDISDLTA